MSDRKLLTFIIAIITLICLDDVNEDGCNIQTKNHDRTQKYVTKGPEPV